MLSQTYLDYIDYTKFLRNVVPAWSAQHCIGYLFHKSCILAMGQHSTDNFLMQCWPKQIQAKLQIIFLCRKVVCGLWASITQVRFLCNVGTGRSDNIVQVMFLRKRVCALRANIVQVIWTILTKQYFYAMLSQHSRYNIVQVIFFIKVVSLPWANIAQVIFLCNVGPKRFGYYCRLWTVQ